MRSAPQHTGWCVSQSNVLTWIWLVGGLLTVGILALLMPVHGEAAASSLQQGQPQARIGTWELTLVADWQQGITEDLLISNNAGGELRLAEDATQGSFLSDPFETRFYLNAAGAYWRADLPPDTDITLELRGRSTPPEPGDIASDAGWGAWQPLIAGDALSQADDGAFATPDVVRFPENTDYLQVRIRFSSDAARASAVLTELTIAYMETMQGLRTPPEALRDLAGLYVPITTGPDTLTPPPNIVQRSTWSAARTTTILNRTPPRGVLIHQVDATPVPTDTLALLRALATYQTDVLGWDDLVYHYLIDNTGILYEGRWGGPTSQVSRLAGNDTAVHVALIGEMDEAPSEAAQQTLVALLAWLGQAYDIPPTDEHTVFFNNSLQERPNIAAHGEVVPAAPDPGEPLREILPDIRTRADQATIRARWYFAEGNPQDYTQLLSFLNPADTATTAEVMLFVDGNFDPLVETVPVDANGSATLRVNDILSDTTNVSWVIEASEPIITQRTMGLPNDLDVRPGASQISRVWYFAEGSTVPPFQTFLIMFNPQDTPTSTTITYMQGDGSLAEQSIILGPRQRLAINVSDVLPGVDFGTQIIANQPIVAERTMRFGENNAGLHTSPGIIELSREWFFAEGTTQAPFETRLLLLNPNRQSTVASVRFMTRDGTSLTRRYAIPATTQLVVDVNEVVPELGVATVVESDRPLVAERAFYISSETAEEAAAENDAVALRIDTPAIIGSVSSGAIQPAFSWRFAEGRVNDAQQFLLFSNPSRGQAIVTAEFLLANGERSSQSILMPASSRFTLPVSEIYSDQATVSIIVRSTQPIVTERSIFPTSGLGANGGTASLGVPGP